MYSIQELVKKLDLEVVTKNINIDNSSVTGVYIGDLLSWVMANIKSGDAWITIQTHTNIIAVAALGEASCIIIPEGAEIEENTVKKAEEHDIPLFRSPLTAYELAVKINRIVDAK